MSDLSAAAEAMGLPEALVERSAEARAAETGASVDEILAQWAGGEAAPAPSKEEPAEGDEGGATTEEAPAEEKAPEDEEQAEPAPPTPVIETPEPTTEEAPVTAAAAGPYKPPVLVGARDNPMILLAGVIGLFFIVVMVGLVGPAMPTETPGARTSNIDYSADAIRGQDLYVSTGCAACHTQMVRPVVADVGLGPVTLNDTNQILGTRRFGPDLSDVGSRLGESEIEAIIGGAGEHPTLSLAAEDLADLVAYLSESAPGGGS
ncbi:MAG: cbb3-type cytochrome c oxidase subunit II [Actinomycetota bacterium]